MSRRILIALLLVTIPLVAVKGTSAQAQKSITPFTRLGRGTATSLAWSPDGKQIAVGGNNGLWLYTDAFQDIAHLTDSRDLIPPADISAIAWNPNDKQIVVGRFDGIARIWDVPAQKSMITLQGHIGGINSAAWSPDGTKIATAGDDATVRLWDAADGHLIFTLKKHLTRVLKVTFSPDGTRLATTGADSAVILWEVATGKSPSTPQGHQDEVLDVAWSPDGTKFATASRDKSVRVWNASNGENIAVLKGHSERVIAVSWNADNNTIYSIGWDSFRVWSVKDRAQQKVFAPVPYRVSASAWNGSRFAILGSDNVIQLWDVAKDNAKDGFSPSASFAVHTDKLDSVSFRPIDPLDPSLLVTGGQDGRVRLWNSATQIVKPLYRHQQRIFAVAWSPDGKQIVSASADRTVTITDLEGNVAFTINGFSDAIHTVKWSPDGQIIAIGSWDHSLRLVDAKGNYLRRIDAETPINALAWSPDSKTIVVGGWGSIMTVFDSISGQKVEQFEGYNGAIYALAWSPDGKQIASGGEDGLLRIWQPQAGKTNPTATLKNLASSVPAPINAIAWSPDGKTVIAGSTNHQIEGWDIATGTLHFTLVGHQAAVLGLDWNRTGTMIASVGADQALLLWSMADDK